MMLFKFQEAGPVFELFGGEKFQPGLKITMKEAAKNE